MTVADLEAIKCEEGDGCQLDGMRGSRDMVIDDSQNQSPTATKKHGVVQGNAVSARGLVK